MNAEELQNIWDPRVALTTLTRKDILPIAFGTALITSIFMLFQFFGAEVGVDASGRSALQWLVDRWSDSGISMGSGDYSHGFLVPLASLYVVWAQRDALIQAPKRVVPGAIVFIALSLLCHYIGYTSQQHRISIVGLIGLCWSIPLYFYGWHVGLRLIFPCAFLLFAVPLNFLDQLTFPLRIINTEISVEILQMIGLDVRQVGTAIYGPPYDARATLKLDVADPCSGIRSLTAMMALTAIYGYIVLPGIWRRWALFLLAIPLAMAGNIFRIVGIGILAEAIDTRLATGLPHDYAGFIVFGFAISLMVMLSLFLRREFHVPGRPDVRF